MRPASNGGDVPSTPSAPRIRERKRDGKRIWQLKCPNCGKWGDLDDDQFHGRVSTFHEECGFHETQDWSLVGLTLEDEAGVF